MRLTIGERGLESLHLLLPFHGLFPSANAGADAGERGGRRERTWEQTRMHTAPRSLTSIGSRFPSQQVFGHDTHIAIGRQVIEE